MNVHSDISFMILSSPNIGGIFSYLHSRNYQISEIDKFSNGIFEKCLIAFSENSGGSIVPDINHLFKIFDIKSIIYKFSGYKKPMVVHKDGSKSFLEIVFYSNDPDLDSYIREGVSFSFIKSKEYFYPKKKDEFREGMIVECFSTSGWIEKTVGKNVEEEYKSVYSILSKYDRIRVPM